MKSILLSQDNIKPLSIKFNGGDISSDAGVLLLKEVDKQIGLTQKMAENIPDTRDQRYIDHSYLELLRQRIAQISAGYEDANDCNSLRYDPIFKIFTGRNPESDAPLGSQPTMTRFENQIRNSSLYRLAKVFVDVFIQSYEREPEVIVLDFDDTEDRVHGGQQLSLFNGFYEERCFLPLHVYEGISGKLVTTILKPGKRSDGKLTLAILRRLVMYLRQFWKKTIIIFRGDGHFMSPIVMDFIESQENVLYVTGLSAYPTLQEIIKPLIQQVSQIYQKSRNRIIRYHSFRYKATSWSKYRRVVAKIEMTDNKMNVRFIVTDMEQAKAKTLFEQVYQPRGQAELYIKEHKLYLRSDKTSCHRFAANQFRVLLHSAAYVLFHSFRTNLLQYTQWAKASIQTIRLRLLKIGVLVKEMKTRTNITFPSSCPEKKHMGSWFEIFTLLPDT
jgi:hypothetical protein